MGSGCFEEELAMAQRASLDALARRTELGTQSQRPQQQTGGIVLTGDNARLHRRALEREQVKKEAECIDVDAEEEVTSADGGNNNGGGAESPQNNQDSKKNDGEEQDDIHK